MQYKGHNTKNQVEQIDYDNRIEEAKVFIQDERKQPISRIELIVKKEILLTMNAMLRGLPNERLESILSRSIDIVRDELTAICNKQL